MNDVKCPKCNGQDFTKVGFLKSGKQRYKCKICGVGFSSPISIQRYNIEKRCPECGGELRPKGWNTSGTRRYKCKECGKSCSDSTGKRTSKLDKKCIYCNSDNVKRSGTLRDGTPRYVCNNCKKGFSDKTVIKDLSGIKCTYCNSEHITTSGKDGKSGKQRYLCHNCKKRFVLNPTHKLYAFHLKTCPLCGYEKAKKAGKSSNNNQYYICQKCGHKFLENPCYKLLTEQQKSDIIKLNLKGTSVKSIADKFNCHEKTIRNIMNNYAKNETLTKAQLDLIIKYGVQLAIPAEFVAPYVPCTLSKCKSILSNYEIQEPKKQELTEQEWKREKIFLDRFTA